MTQNSLPLQVFVFNVGQGDNLLLRLPDGSYGVIDFFYDGDINPEGEPPSLTFLKHKFKQKEPVVIRFLHLSHYHFDHIHGLEKWIQWVEKYKIPVGHLWMPGAISPKSTLQRLTKILSNPAVLASFFKDEVDLVDRFNKLIVDYKNGTFFLLDRFVKRYNKKNSGSTQFLDCIRPLVISYSPGTQPVKAFCLAPTSDRAANFNQKSTESLLKTILRPKKNPSLPGNDISAILLLEYASNKLLFGGDAEQDSIEESILQFSRGFGQTLNTDFVANFVKIFHHGAKYSSSPHIWDSILPNDNEIFIAISAGRRYEHPDPETLQHITDTAASKNCSANIYATNIDYLIEKSPIHKAKSLNLVQGDRLKYIDKINEKSRKLDAFVRLTVSSAEKQHSATTLLGYCFEFDAINNKVDVRNLVD